MKRREFLASSIAATGVAAVQAGRSMAQAQQDRRRTRAPAIRAAPAAPWATASAEYPEERIAPGTQPRGGPHGRRIHPVSAAPFAGDPICALLYALDPGVRDPNARLEADAEDKKAADAHAALPATRSGLRAHLQPADGRGDVHACVDVPPAAAGNKPRILELRTYESHSKRASRKKLQMFGELGELAIFRRTGLRPVFFGDNLIGDRLPSFTYMLTFDDMAAREKNWAGFIADPEWNKLRATQGYTDPEIVSNITSIILRPTEYSQL